MPAYESCEACNKPWTQGRTKPFCSYGCLWQLHLADPGRFPEPAWKQNCHGYWVGGWCGFQTSQHVWIMEHLIGRPLIDGEIVHHVNGDKSDNRLSNLTIVSHAEHGRLHREMNAMAMELYRVFLAWVDETKKERLAFNQTAA